MLHQPPVKTCIISGVYMDMNVVTHFAVHKYYAPAVSGATKLSIDETIELITKYGQTLYAWQWDYQQGAFVLGPRVYHKISDRGNYLHLAPFTRETKNLRHLICLNWFQTGRSGFRKVKS